MDSSEMRELLNKVKKLNEEAEARVKLSEVNDQLTADEIAQSIKNIVVNQSPPVTKLTNPVKGQDGTSDMLKGYLMEILGFLYSLKKLMTIYSALPQTNYDITSNACIAPETINAMMKSINLSIELIKTAGNALIHNKLEGLDIINTTVLKKLDVFQVTFKYIIDALESEMLKRKVRYPVFTNRLLISLQKVQALVDQARSVPGLLSVDAVKAKYMTPSSSAKPNTNPNKIIPVYGRPTN